MENRGKKHILIVDDDPLIGRMYEHRLKNDGFSVEVASNGEEAIAAVKKNPPGLIYLDVMMPKLNGVETLKMLKADKQTKNIPIVILTNLGDREGDIANAKKLGALDYFVKSKISLKEFSERTKKILEKE